MERGAPLLPRTRRAAKHWRLGPRSVSILFRPQPQAEHAGELSGTLRLRREDRDHDVPN